MKKTDYLGIIFFIIFCISVIILSLFHEPWFDEFQAWEVSKDSIYNILFSVPHYEGHPPLWHLILKCFSFFNVNPEIGIRIPNLIFMFSAVWLLIFKSPFPRAVKLLLPFTYFIFYQYSIVSRPYSIFCFALFLSALFYKERNEHPFKFVFALALLCLSCAYGMILAAGIIIVWFIEIIYKQNIVEFIKIFAKDKRFYAMVLIFLLCLILTVIIYPAEDVIYKPLFDDSISFWKRCIYTVFIIPVDALFYNSTNYASINTVNNNPYIISIGCIFGILANLLFFFIFKTSKKLLFFYLPYLMILIAFFSLYVASHHIGLLFIFYIFVQWCVLTQKPSVCNSKKILHIAAVSLITITMTVQIYWTFCAGFHEIIFPYSSSREIALFIKINKFYKYKIMERVFESPYYINTKTGKIYNDTLSIPEKEKNENVINKVLTLLIAPGHDIAVFINPYYKRNIIYNFNIVNSNKNYVVLRKKSDDEITEMIAKIKSYGFPDIILNQSKPEGIFSDEELELNNIEYIFLKKFPNYRIWKSKYSIYYDIFCIRSDLYNKLTPA